MPLISYQLTSLLTILLSNVVLSSGIEVKSTFNCTDHDMHTDGAVSSHVSSCELAGFLAFFIVI